MIAMLCSKSDRRKPHFMTIADRPVKLLVRAIAEVTRSLLRTTPAPRGMPFFGLDMEVHEPRVLDDFCRQGIFRKYERVLIVNCGLGGAARWWAARWGCTVVGSDADAALASGADFLSRRAGVHGPSTFAAALGSAAPLRPECVTHVWIRDLRAVGDVAGALRQAYQTLRPGGHVMAESAVATVIEALRETAGPEGFIAIETQRVAAVPAPHSLLIALNQLDGFIARTADDTHRTRLRDLVAAQLRAVQELQPRQQFFAQRPS
jgi:hypothetical protein